MIAPGEYKPLFQSVLENPWLNSLLSVTLLVAMFRYRESLVPGFLHLFTAMVEEEIAFLTVMVYWGLWKCWLMPEEQPSGHIPATREAKTKERVRIVTLALLELLLSLSLSQAPSYWDYLYCLTAFTFTAVRSLYHEQLDLLSLLFLAIYLMQNFIVHAVDFVVVQQCLGMQNDEQLFTRMFSYKVFQGVLVLQLALVYAQSIRPTLAVVQENPRVLLTIFNHTIVVNCTMVITFLYEITFYDQHQRASIFRTMLIKVFTTNISVYLFAVIYSHWL